MTRQLDSHRDGAEASPARVLLDETMGRLRRDRPLTDKASPFYVKVDSFRGGAFAQLWFLTRGCTWDRRGACTMCNYGRCDEVSATDMATFVELGLETIEGTIDELYVSPSGSLLDPLEVPEEARSAICASVARFPARRFSLESRAETVTAGVVDRLVADTPGKQVAVGLGLESADPWIQRFCVNKHSTPSAFSRASRVLGQRGVEVYANVSLGTAFLTPREALDDAARSVEWALGNGADLVLVFPMHVKRNTLLAWLYDQGRYEPPSLWSLVEVVKSVDPRHLAKVNVAWYRGDYGTDPGTLASPSSCPHCQPRVLQALDRHRARPTASSLDELARLDCRCRRLWLETVSASPGQDLRTRVFAEYQALAADFGLAEWWSTNADAVLGELNGRTCGRTRGR